ncbi:MAG: IS4 family transposase, partial [Verrucomicrobiae bacterium]|nr:IS4 family transposase [Verrucomicrobiae bacterium]
KRKSGNQYVHHETKEYREHVHRKMRAYHIFVQCGAIAQGMLNYLAMTQKEQVWKHFGSWIRTIRPDVLPSEAIVSDALKNTFPEFLHQHSGASRWSKFLLSRIDSNRSEGTCLAS